MPKAKVHLGNVGYSTSETSFPKDDPPALIAYLVKSGRAVFWPIYKGTYERWFELRSGWSFKREYNLQFSRDFFRSIDYLEQRPELDLKKLAYFGDSRGSWYGMPLLAIDDRPKVAVFHGGGLTVFKVPLPEIDGFNYAPAVKIPVLMINGRNDAIFQLEINQRPLFRLLGTPEKDKSHRLFDAGHVLPAEIVERETLAWLDKYLGPVTR
jgi:hypothetical protein